MCHFVCPCMQFSRVGLAISMYASNKASDVMEEGGGSPVRESELSFSPIRNSELYPHNHKVVGKKEPEEERRCVYVYNS